MRATVLATAVYSILANLATAGEVGAAIKRTTDIPPQELAPALQRLVAERDIQLVYRADLIRGRKTNGASGEIPAVEALSQLLSGTGLTYVYLDDRTITIVPIGGGGESSGETELDSDTPNSTASSRTEVQSDRGLSGRFRLARADLAQASGGREDAAEYTGVEEVIVTAQKREERLQDVPIPVTAISASSLLESNQTRIPDYYSKIPGLNVTPSVQGQQNLSIRGITTGFSNPTVGITIDDVPYGSSGGRPTGLMAPDVDPGDLARVEVLRGPQGALYGASSMGGLFKLVTVDPSMDALTGRVQATGISVRNGDDLGYNVRGLINVPLSDSLALRASGFTREDPGFIDNVQTGEKSINRANVNGGRVAALWKPGSNFSLKLSAIYQDYEGDGQSEVDNLPGLLELQQSRLIGSGEFERELQAYSAIMNARFGAAEITAVSGYNISENHDTFDFTGSFGPPLIPVHGVVGVPVYTDSKVERFSQEVRLAMPIGARVEWLLGGFYSDESTEFDQTIPAVDPATGAFVAHTRIIELGVLHVEEYAAFTDVTYHFSDRFDVQIGGRFARIEQATDAGTAQRFPPVGTGALTITPAIDTEPDDVFTYLFTPRFRISDDLMVYLRAASGYRIGGGGTSTPNDNCIRFAFPCQFGPDKTQNYELGAKGSVFDQALSFEASVYHIDWKDIQIQGYNVAAGATFNTNGSRATSRGVELSLTAKPSDGLSITAWGVWSDAKLTEPLPIGPSLPIGEDGARLPLSSRRSGSLSVDQEFPLTNRATVSVGGAVTYIGSRPGLFVNSGSRVTYPAYTKVDLLAHFSYESWAVDLFVNNVTDEYAELSGGPGFFPPTSASILQPRTLGLSLTKNF